MQSIAAQQAQREMFAQFKNELARQGGFRADATSGLYKGLDTQSKENSDQLRSEGAANRMASYTPVSLGSTFSPSLKDNAKLNLLGKLRAALGSYGDWQSQMPIDQAHTQEGINKMIDVARGQAQIFPYRMNEAQHSWDELAFWGQMVSSIGGSAGNWASMFGAPQGGQMSQQRPTWAGPDQNPWQGGGTMFA